MKITMTLFMLLVLFLPTTPAQDHTQMNLPEGALVRLGKGSVREVLYSPDGTLLAVYSSIGIWLYDTTTYRAVALLPAEPGWRHSIAFSPDGATVATTGSSDITVRLWNSETGEQKGTLTGHTGEIAGVVFSPDGKTLASWGLDGTVRLWDTATWEQKGTLTGHTEGVSGVVFSPDGRTVASTQSDKFCSYYIC